MSYSLNSLEEGYIGDYIGTIMGVIEGDTRSFEYGSYRISSHAELQAMDKRWQFGRN